MPNSLINPKKSLISEKPLDPSNISWSWFTGPVVYADKCSKCNITLRSSQDAGIIDLKIGGITRNLRIHAHCFIEDCIEDWNRRTTDKISAGNPNKIGSEAAREIVSHLSDRDWESFDLWHSTHAKLRRMNISLTHAFLGAATNTPGNPMPPTSPP